MKIKSMTATFGGLKNAKLTPGPGLTLIHAPNEGGKSTWAAFWRAMLYGIDTRDRDKKGYLADKNRYQPWSGARMEGELVLELAGRDITIRRGPRGNIPFGAFSAVYTGTEEPVPGLTAANCGELLTGVGAEVFSRSAFLGSGSGPLTTAPELERRIAALVSSGEEDVSFSQAMGRLRDWKNRRQVNKSVGEIPKLEGELAQIKSALSQLEGVAVQVSRLEAERAALERTRDFLAQEAETHRQLSQSKLDRRYAQAEREYQLAQAQVIRLEGEQKRLGTVPDREALKEAQGELQYLKVLEEEIKQASAALAEAEARAAQDAEAARDDLFPELTGDQAVSRAGEINSACRAAKQEIERAGRLARRFVISLAAVTAGGVLARLFGVRPASDSVLLGTLAGVAVMALATCLWSFFRKRRQRALARGLLEPYGVQTAEELTALAQSYQERCQKAEKTAHEVEVIQNAVAERQEKRDATRSGLLEFAHGFAPEVTDMFGCSAALSRALGLDHDMSLARDRLEERRRRLEDLEAQGAKGGEDAPVPPAPARGPEETAQALAQTASRLEQISAQLNQAQGSLQTMGDPAALAAQREELENTLSQKRLELEAIALAAEGLNQANTQLQERFSPELNRLTGEYMAQLTGGKYSAVTFTRELEGFVQTGDSLLPRSALYLSQGTADQLYLAVRLAVCRLCLPERPPILMDDALTAFDDTRLEYALKLLRELSGEQQLLLFTCQKRESEVLGGDSGVTRVEL